MDITHYIISSTGKHYGITERTEKQLIIAGLNDLIEVSQGVKIKVSAIMEILPIAQYREEYPEKQIKNYGQPYTPIDHMKALEAGKPINNKGFKEQMREWFEKHPEKKNTPAYRFFQNHKQFKSSGGKYTPTQNFVKNEDGTFAYVPLEK